MIQRSAHAAFVAAKAELIRREEVLHNLQPQASDCVKQMQFVRAYGGSPSHLSMIWLTGHLLHGSGFTEQVLARTKHDSSGRITTHRLIESYSQFLMPDRYIANVLAKFFITRHEPINQDECLSTLVQHTARPASLQAIDLSTLRQRFRP